MVQLNQTIYPNFQMQSILLVCHTLNQQNQIVAYLNFRKSQKQSSNGMQDTKIHE